MPNFCSVEGCNKPCHGLGLCDKHYRRYKRNGHPGLQLKKAPLKCSAPDCTRFAYARGLCGKHYQRMVSKGTLDVTERDKSGIAAAFPKEYKAWLHIKSRCMNPEDNSYKNYGGRGIAVCNRWTEKPYGFRHFLEDMGPKPGSEYSVDRIDNDGPYSPENCRWATRKEQANNRRVRVDAWIYERRGEKKTLKQWSDEEGVPMARLRNRYYSKTFNKENLLEKRDFRRKI